VVLTLNFDFADEILTCDPHSNESSGAVLTVVLFITLYKVILTFQSVRKNLTSDHSNESY